MTLHDLLNTTTITNKGIRVRRAGFVSKAYLHIYMDSENPLYPTIKPMGCSDMSITTFFCDDWKIIPEYVSWPQAWEALKAGKKIMVDDMVVHIYEPKHKTYGDFVLKAVYQDGSLERTRVDIPLTWLDKKDFIILED